MRVSKRPLTLLLLCAVIGMQLTSFAQEAKSKPTLEQGIIHNEDCSNYFMLNPAEDMCIDSLNAFIDRYAGTQLSHMFLNGNAMRTSFKSAVRGPIWGDKGLEERLENATFTSENGLNWAKNTHLLMEKGIDPYAVWIERCKKHHISPWMSMRMNDCHDNFEAKSYMHSALWVEHPEYWRGGSGYFKRCLNYAEEAVYQHQMDLVKEYLQRYDLDGLELDWMRECYCFKPGEEEKGRAILTKFMRELRAFARQCGDKRGRPIQIAARVPALPEAAYGWGLDGVAWVKEGLVDMLIPTARWASADFDIPMDVWREKLGESAKTISLAAGMEIRVQPYPGAAAIMSDLEILRGFSAAMLERGADQIYLFNHMHKLSIPTEEVRSIITDTGSLESLEGKARRHVVAYHDIAPPNTTLKNPLPAELKRKKTATIALYTGHPISSGKAIARVGLDASKGYEDAPLALSLNKTACTAIADHGEPESFCDAARILQFEIPLDALQRGYNTAEITLPEGRTQQVVWMELYFAPESS